jgi:hypothetical protein
MEVSAMQRSPDTRTPRTQRPQVSEVVAFLRDHFSDQYVEAYEHGKRQFAEAIARRFDLAGGEASDLVDELERSLAIRFRKKTGGPDNEGPRLGLFDEPRVPPRGEPEPEFAGHYWEIGRDAKIIGAL